jgi:hypothetical protein
MTFGNSRCLDVLLFGNVMLLAGYGLLILGFSCEIVDFKIIDAYIFWRGWESSLTAKLIKKKFDKSVS